MSRRRYKLRSSYEPMRDYFVYLPQRPPGNIWGRTATSVGFARVAPRAKYPPTMHPADHHFEWSDGRILQCYQIILIAEGSGVFESEHIREPQPVESGTVILLSRDVAPLYSRYGHRMGRAWDRVSRTHVRRSRSDGNFNQVSPFFILVSSLTC